MVNTPAAFAGPGPLRFRTLALTIAAVLGAGVCAAVTWYGGSVEAAQSGPYSGDTGWTPWLLPLSRLLMQAAAAVTVGCLIAAVFFVPGELSARKRVLIAPSARGWLRGASWSAVVWAVAAVGCACVTLSELIGVKVGDAVSWHNLRILVTRVEVGRALLAVFVLAVLIAIACRFVSAVSSAAVVTVIAIGAAMPLAFTGHAANSANHQLAVSTMLLHVVGAVIWTGGLVALLLGRRRPSKSLTATVRRFSTLAVCCFALVGLTGLISATIRMSRWSDFGSEYGKLVLLKFAALVALGGFGWWHRRVSLRALAAGRRGTFARIAWVEVLVMAATLGLAAGLARTSPPNKYRIEELTQTPLRRMVDWLPDPLFLILAVGAVACYLIGIRRLHRQGESWPVARTAAWITGWLVVLGATNLQLARNNEADDRIEGLIAGVQQAQHLAIAVLAPLLLVLGGAVGLATRALRPATEKHMRGPLEWVLAARQARLTRMLSHPAAGLALYAAALYCVYASSRYGFALTSHAGHLATFAGALAAGSFFFGLVLGGESSPRRLPGLVRLALAIAGTTLLSILGVALLRATPLAEVRGTWLELSFMLSLTMWVLLHFSTKTPRPPSASTPNGSTPNGTPQVVTSGAVRTSAPEPAAVPASGSESGSESGSKSAHKPDSEPARGPAPTSGSQPTPDPTPHAAAGAATSGAAPVPRQRRARPAPGARTGPRQRSRKRQRP